MISSTITNQATYPSTATTRIVAIGASAGGLEALEQFLKRTPPDSGLAYIVVQHLDPTRQTLLSRLLQRATELPVADAKNGMHIRPDNVYVIPPNSELSVVGDRLNVTIPSEPRGLRLPINVLFSSLARVQGERAIAVVLSGMGSDGTLGMQAIKATGGLTVVQDPASAQFDSMPKSAIAAGCADIVGLPERLPGLILSSIKRESSSAQDLKLAAQDITTPTRDESAANPLQHITALLQAHTRHDFSLYKSSTLLRRIARRMAIHDLSSMGSYAEFLEQNVSEIELLFKELLIGVTSFFRDPEVWMYLAEVVLPELLARRIEIHKLRAWSIGCSTGEEAYSLAIIFSEALQRLPHPLKYTVQIFASDLSADAIAIARRGEYPLSIADSVSPERLAHFFNIHEKYYQVNQSIRDMVLFANHDVILDPPFTRLDLIACRNLLIYFDPQLQGRLLPLFHYSLRPGGVLMLGNSETVGRSTRLFAPVKNKLRLYLRQEHSSIRKPEFLLGSFPPLSQKNQETHMTPSNVPGLSSDNLQTAADHLLLQVYAPAAVVLNQDGDIVYISGRTGKYLEPAAGKANWNFYAMAHEGLRESINAAIKQAGSQSGPIQLHNLKVHSADSIRYVDVTVQALNEPVVLQGMTMIVFRDVAAPSPGKSRGKKSAVDMNLAAELQQHMDEIKILREETRSSREELQSANEELQSTNEELQSTNEELTTSKEEMQSMNEELQTINNELQAKLDDLALAQSDMKNILNSVEIAILFLDQNLNVRRYTDRASKIINLRESDIGRPLSDLTTSLHYPQLHHDALETLRTLMTSEKQITTDDNRWFSVRIIPYRRIDNMIDGIVITLVDITETKRLESRLRQDQDT